MARAQITLTPGTGIGGPRIGQYMGIRAQFTRVVRKERFVVAVYAAYNAMGLIGSEHNGVCVINLTKNKVVTDMVGCAGTGWHGATLAQMDVFNNLHEMKGDEFLSHLKQMPRFRGEHTLPT